MPVTASPCTCFPAEILLGLGGRGVRAGVLDRHAWHGQREAGVASAAAILLAAALLAWLLVTVGPPEADQSR
jgi:hypothetical protein